MNNPETKQAAERLRVRMEKAKTSISLLDFAAVDIRIILEALAAMETELADRDSRLAAAGPPSSLITYLRCLSAFQNADDQARITEVIECIAAAQRSAEDARRDSARLDWLEKHGTFIEVGQIAVGTSRADIDAAVAARGAKKS